MKPLVAFAIAAIVLMGATICAESRHQVGTAASGRAGAKSLRLESVMGQSVSGIAGDITSGFLSQQAGQGYLAGDADGNGLVNISDVIYLVQYVFGGGPPPQTLESGDADCNEMVNVSDAVFLIAYIFSGGAAPHFCK